MSGITLRARHAVVHGRLEHDVVVRVEDGWIVEPRGAGAPGHERAIAGTLLPGFVDLQVNGMGGIGFEDGDDDAFDAAAHAVRAGGAAAFLPTLITAPLDRLVERASRLASWVKRRGPTAAATPLGIHLEGPFLELAGAHDATALIEPDARSVGRLLDACAGTLRLVTLAPGLPGAVEAVARLRAAGVAVAFGHARSTRQFDACVDAGATLVTHLFNAMSPLHHRDPGITGLALDELRLSCCLIADGHHVHPAVLRTAWRVLGCARTILVTDAIAAAGMSDGAYSLAGLAVQSRGGVVRDARGTLAGSALTMTEAVTRFARFVNGLAAPELAAIAAENPARAIGAAEFGALSAGCRAAFAVLDDAGGLHDLKLG